MYYCIVFDKIEEAEQMKRILGDSVFLMGNRLSCFDDKETFDVVLGYCESNKWEISLEKEENE